MFREVLGLAGCKLKGSSTVGLQKRPLAFGFCNKESLEPNESIFGRVLSAMIIGRLAANLAVLGI